MQHKCKKNDEDVDEESCIADYNDDYEEDQWNS